jgi:predicted nucleic acid-binding protein
VKKRVAVDTGPLVALFDHSDADHQKARDFFFSHAFDGIVTTAVVAETTHLLGFQPRAAVEFLQWLKRAALKIEEFTADLDRIIALMTKYADVPMDFADATIIAASERLNIREIVTLDSDFLVYRLRGKQHLHNLFPY